LGLDLHPLMGLIGGTITLVGGHGTGAAYAERFAEVNNLQSIMELSMTAPTLGLVFGGIVGGPLAQWLIRRHRLAGGAHDHATEADGGSAEAPVNLANFLGVLAATLLALVGGQQLAAWVGEGTVTVPGFLWCLLLGVAIRNLAPLLGLRLNDGAIDLMASLTLSLFLVMTMMALDLAQVVGLAGPLLLMVVAQTVLAVLYGAWVVYRLVGRDYESAVLSASFCGFAIGSTATAMANIQAITRTSILVGLGVFFGLSFGLSFVDDRIKSSWDVENFIGVNLLGIIPDLSDIDDKEKYRLVLDNQNERGSESFLGVYSAAKIHSKLDFPKAILVTSTIPGEGKTLVSSNLAGSFARHGKRTLIIDCDLRRPMLHRHFEQQNDAGLLKWFENGARLDAPQLSTLPDLGMIRVGENLDLLRSGGRSKSPTELLESPAFTQLIDRLKREYDLVVVDSPPLGAVTDSLLIAESTDEVIYVCRFNRALRKHIRLYIKALRQGKNEILGVVLNGLSARRIEYYSNYRYYRSYKKYYGTTS